jgi:hypothetical protein
LTWLLCVLQVCPLLLVSCVAELDISMAFAILTLTCNLGEKGVSHAVGSIHLCLATIIDTVTLTLVMTDPEMEMSLTEEMSLMVVITITTIRDILETLIEEMAILEGMTIDPLTFKETSPVLVYSMETSKRG